MIPLAQGESNGVSPIHPEEKMQKDKEFDGGDHWNDPVADH